MEEMYVTLIFCVLIACFLFGLYVILAKVYKKAGIKDPEGKALEHTSWWTKRLGRHLEKDAKKAIRDLGDGKDPAGVAKEFGDRAVEELVEEIEEELQ